MLCSCGGSTRKYVPADYRLISQQLKSKGKLVVIDPEVRTLRYSKPARRYVYDYEASARRTDHLRSRMKEAGRLVDLDIDIVRFDSLQANDAYKINDFRALEREMYQTLSLYRPSKLRLKYSNQSNSPRRYIISPLPQLRPEYTTLSKAYGTPYFMIVGAVEFRKKRENSTYTVIIADVERSEIIYQEVRSIPHRLNGDIVSTVVYDSFRQFLRK